MVVAAARRRRAARRGRRTASATRSRAGPLPASARASPARSSRAASRSSCRGSAASRRSSTAPPRRPELREAGAELHLRADHAQPRARSARWPSICKFKPERDYDRSVKFLGVVGVDDRPGGQGPAAGRGGASASWSTRTRTCARSCASATTSRTSSARSGPMRQMYEQVAQVARTNTTVLIRGESGTGKELIAHAIHYNSLRAKKPFVKVSCAALPDSLIESELFGYEKGAFTGAERAQEGALRAGRGRHAVPRRDRRHQPRDAGEAAARAAGARVRAARRHRDGQGRTCA